MSEMDRQPERARTPGAEGVRAADVLPAERATKMTKARLREADMTLREYQMGKAALEERIKQDEKWWELRAWDQMQQQGPAQAAKRPTAWLFNVIMGKHADMMEAYPEPVVLPREKGDEDEAKKLTEILPVVLEQNDFEQTYSDAAWDKNKSGTSCVAIYWDSGKLNGLGDISIVNVDLLNLFWEPGVSDIQKSENVFFASMISKKQLRKMYPQLGHANLDGGVITLKPYDTEDDTKTTDKALVVDWYYHTYEGGKKILQYCKYCAGTVLYASEDDPQVSSEGWYADGDYPFVLDPLFRKKNSVAGYGYIDIGKNTQESIDLLDQALTTNALMNAMPRYLVDDDANLNAEELADWRRMFIRVSDISETRVRPMDVPAMPGGSVTYINQKIEELKQTTGNMDVSNGAAGGVTAASGIAALQESAGRSSRDSIRGTYRAYAAMLQMVISRIRQFYDVARTFRIVGADMQTTYMQYDNRGLRGAPQTDLMGNDMGIRLPVFDIKTGAQKQNAYSKMAQNELALQLLGAGVFNVQMAEQSLLLLETMDFDGKDELVQKLQQQQTMQKQLYMWQQMALQLAARTDPAMAEQMAQTIAAQTGQTMEEGTSTPEVEQTDLSASEETGGEAPFMTRVRERTNAASMPG